MRGRDLQRDAGQKPQIVLMTPILEGLDGVQKMSKSLNNAIGINDPAPDMYGKLMSINDDLMWKYWTFLTDLPQSQIEAMKARVATGELHPMQAKKDLAHSITADFHTSAAADHAAQSWATQFQQRGIAEDAPEITISLASEGLMAVPAAHGGLLTPTTDAALGTDLRLPKLLVLAGLAASTGEAQRKLKENAVSINGVKTSQLAISREALGQSPTLRLGKKSVRIKWMP
jgi:tyrosyl-tRNA synthetase